mgnify:CR=1 FL=1
MGLFKSLFGGNNTPETEKEKNDKKNFEILKYDGIRAQRMGKLPYAIKCFEEAVAINDELETLSLLATAYTQANRLDDARITLDRMATKDPEQVNTFLSLAGICYMQEDYKTMEEACRKAIELDSQKPLAYYFAAKAAIGLHNDFMAIAMLTKAILLKEDYTEAYQLRAETLWNMRQVKEAGEDIQVLLRMNPNDEQALLLDAEIQAATGNTDQAIGQLQQILSLNPFQEKAYFLLGELYLSLKETEKAIAVYDEAIDINPNFAQAYQERGRIKLLNGDKEGSVADMKKALELAPETEEKINGQYNNFTDK